MASLVLDLQSAAMDRGTTVSDLLRRVKVVAAKLQLNEVSEWVDHELNGYPEDDEKIPLYREIRGEVRGLNPLLGWRPVHGDERILAIAGTMKTRQSASELETLITDLKDGSSLSFGVPEAFRKNVDTTAGVPPTDVRVFVQKGQIVAVLDAIRTRVLDWVWMAVENRLNLAAGCGAQRISRRCRDARPLGLAATRRAQVIATPSERRLRQGREAAERTLDAGEHRGIGRRVEQNGGLARHQAFAKLSPSWPTPLAAKLTGSTCGFARSAR
jgi:hypothetical protein